MDSRILKRETPNPAPAKFNTLVVTGRKTEHKSPAPHSTKTLSNCNQQDHLKTQAEERFQKTINELVQSCIHNLQLNNIKKALDKYRELETSIEGRENIWYFYGEIPYNPIKSKIISLDVEPEHFTLLDELRRRVAAKISQLKNISTAQVTHCIRELTNAKNMLKAIKNPNADDIELLSSIFNLMAVHYKQYGDEKSAAICKQKSFQYPDKFYRELVNNKTVKVQRLEYGNQTEAIKCAQEIEAALSKIRKKTPEEQRLQEIYGFFAEKKLARFAHNRNTFMYNIIDGGTVPEEAREKLMAIPIAQPSKST